MNPLIKSIAGAGLRGGVTRWLAAGPRPGGHEVSCSLTWPSTCGQSWTAHRATLP